MKRSSTGVGTPITGAVTITQVAEVAGVSKSTVSLVLQGSDRIRPDTAKRVRRAAKQMGYVYNRGAAGLRGGSSNVIGVVINDLTNPFYAELLVGAERKFSEAGYVVFVAHTGERVETQQRVLASMREQRASAIILCPAFGTAPKLVRELRAWGMPVMIAVRPLGKSSLDFVGADYVTGMAVATTHLIERGHRRIAFMGPRNGGAIYDLRREGFERAMTARSLRMSPRLMVDVAPTRLGGRIGIRRLFEQARPPTAALCYNDVVAFGALSELGEMGLTAGRDFAVVGFDGVIAAAHTNPPLTTMAFEPETLGETAATMLLERLQGRAGAPQVYLATPQLVVRQSSAMNIEKRKR